MSRRGRAVGSGCPRVGAGASLAAGAIAGGHSLRLRLITVFVLLALAMARRVPAGHAARVLQRLARRGAPPGRRLRRSPGGRARHAARASRAHRRSPSGCPISIRIEGPVVNWDSHPRDRLGPTPARRRHGPSRRTADWLCTHARPTATASASASATLPWQHAAALHRLDRRWRCCWCSPRWPMPTCAACCSPLDDIRAGAERFGAGRLCQRRSRCAAATNWATWPRINTMAHDMHAMLDAKRGRCCWP